jgi:uncharacterized membrane protein YheB (UPF0754 family)
MKLTNILSEKRGIVLEKWFDMIAASYPTNAASFFKKQKNQFANPVGYTIEETIKAVIDVLVNEETNEKAYEFLDRLVKVRAVQDFTPSRTVDFLFMLKQVIKDEFKNELQEVGMYEGFLLMESRIDSMVLVSFESYMKYREKIYELKVNEFKNMAFRLLERANLTFEFKDDDLAFEKDVSDSDNVK